jgi:Tfp pilus assembly protein PilF
VEIVADAALAALLKKDGPIDVRPFIARADTVVARFADHPAVYTSRASIRGLAGSSSAKDRQHIRADMNRAIALAPAHPEYLLQRAAFGVEWGECAEARQDLEAARRVPARPSKLLKDVEAQVGTCHAK